MVIGKRNLMNKTSNQNNLLFLIKVFLFFLLLHYFVFLLVVRIKALPGVLNIVFEQKNIEI